MGIEKVTIDIKGKYVEVDSVRLGDVRVILAKGFLRKAWVYDEWYVDVDDPVLFIETLEKLSPRPDLFTFIQRLPHGEPRYPYFWEPESWAVLPVTSFDHWWKDQITDKTRNSARKAEKKEVVIKRPEFDDAFVQGMVEIFNETSIRQGRPFWHYGKDFETVKTEFSRFLFRESLIGAYYRDELIGFIMLGYAGEYAVIGQIISKLEHRDKSTNNALMAEAVRICEEKKIPFLFYAGWDDRSLGKFKKHNGFERFDIPRYFVPLTMKGRLVLLLKLHHGVRDLIPQNIKDKLRDLRNRYYSYTRSRKTN